MSPIFLRRAHLYLSVFFAPLLLMFILTGWWQTVVSSDDQERDGGMIHTLIQKLSTVHTDDYFPHGDTSKHARTTMKTLVGTMCGALLVSVGLGLYLAWTTIRSRWPVLLAFALGILVPVLILWLA